MFSPVKLKELIADFRKYFSFEAIPKNLQAVFGTPEVENRIKQFENNLMSWVQTQDAVKWSLSERMSFYNIQGLSIAVIHDYKIEWAKGYGFPDVSERRPVTPQTFFH